MGYKGKESKILILGNLLRARIISAKKAGKKGRNSLLGKNKGPMQKKKNKKNKKNVNFKK